MINKDFSEVDNSNEFKNLNEVEKGVLVNWIEKNLVPYRTNGYYNHHSSYGLKHKFEKSEQGFYVTNGEYKGAMLHAGFKPKDVNDLNWTFQLSKKAGT